MNNPDKQELDAMEDALRSRDHIADVSKKETVAEKEPAAKQATGNESLFGLSDTPAYPEPEYLTTETDAGFRAVVLHLYMCASDVQMFNKGKWRECPYDYGVDTLVCWVKKDNTVYRIKNPAYKPPREPQVGDVWECEHGYIALIISSGARTCDVIFYDDGQIRKGSWSLSEFIKFTGKTIDLSVLVGGEL